MPKLVAVPTPIGNLKDITLRALEVLKDADFILAEDTRTTGFLLKHFEIKSRMVSFHMHNEHKQLANIVSQIESSNLVAMVTDAGTPGISDPGYLLIRGCIDAGIEVECLPGATALIPAIVSAGLPNDRFVFEGFLPQKKGRQKRIENIMNEPRTIVFYESPHRLLKLLEQLLEILKQDRQICVCRELSKLHEEVYRGKISEAIAHFSQKTIKGEIVVVLQGQKNEE